MKDFKSMYYINNIPWKSKFLIDRVKRFDDMRFSDIIVFHYDFAYSIFKVETKSIGYNKKIFVSAINACLRYYELIKKLYPHNKIRVVIHLNKNVKLSIGYDTFRSVIDILPNFAVCQDVSELDDFKSDSYKHIVYGNLKYEPNYKQIWSVINGSVIIKDKSNKMKEGE